MTPAQERDRLIRQLVKAEAQGPVGNAAATILRSKLQEHERRQDRITVHSDGSVWNDSLLARFADMPR